MAKTTSSGMSARRKSGGGGEGSAGGAGTSGGGGGETKATSSTNTQTTVSSDTEAKRASASEQKAKVGSGKRPSGQVEAEVNIINKNLNRFLRRYGPYNSATAAEDFGDYITDRHSGIGNLLKEHGVQLWPYGDIEKITRGDITIARWTGEGDRRSVVRCGDDWYVEFTGNMGDVKASAHKGRYPHKRSERG